MQNIKDTLQIISIQHELTMNIGLSLELDKMLDSFLLVLQRRLSLTSCHAYVPPELPETGCHKGLYYASSPKCNGLARESRCQADHIFINAKEQLHSQAFFYHEQQPTHFYAFKIGELGFLVLERLNKPIESSVLNALNTVIEKLALSCIACLQHKSLQVEIEHREQVEQALKRQAYLDPLTALPNRKMLYQQLRKALSSTNKNNSYGALFYLDVDRFKNINDTLGHTQGDELLIAITHALKSILSNQDIIARVGGDEFVVLSQNIANNELEAQVMAAKLATSMTELFERSIQLSRNKVRTSVSIGIVTFANTQTRHTATRKYCEQIVHNADIAMYQAKSENRNGYQFYQPSMQEKAERHANIEKWLSQAGIKKQFQLYYQPLVNKSGQVIAAEALLRWQHKEFGFISPSEFIPIAEESGHIIAIGEFVIEEVCKTVSHLLRQGVNFNYVAVNISPRQFQHPSFVDYLLDKVKQYDIPPCYLKLEVTEGLAIEGIEQAIEKMNTLIKHDFHFLLDDFGSGYSSLSYLHKLPLEAVKIDKSFISDVSGHIEHQVIANAIIDIADRLNIGCIAEGVETAEDIAYLQQKRVTSFQGYYYYKPMPKEAFFDLVQTSNTVRMCINN